MYSSSCARTIYNVSGHTERNVVPPKGMEARIA
jgi:hypothetical protein